MLTEGLLWFDDDSRRPLSEKITDAIARYSERTGWQPSVCEMHPAQVEAFNAEVARAATKRPAKSGAAPVVTLPPKLRIMPNAALRPGYFLIGIEVGERPRKAVSHLASATPRKAKRPAAVSSATPEPASVTASRKAKRSIAAAPAAATEPASVATPSRAARPRVKAS